MSIVEKAAEKLKALPTEPPAPPAANGSGTDAAAAQPAPAHTASTVERLQDRARVAADQPLETVPPWHIDPVALKRMGLLPADDAAERRLADEMRGIKRPLLANATDKGAETLVPGRRILVTSAEASEGKTFTAVNLAWSLAREADFEVLLVDGDIP
jgi:Mrp family chromosome partitioning ATPase